jgi:hypothetical protein
MSSGWTEQIPIREGGESKTCFIDHMRGGVPDCCKRAWLLKNSLSKKNSLEFGDGECLPASWKSLITHPDANQFWQISGKRVFQQPQATSIRTDSSTQMSNRGGGLRWGLLLNYSDGLDGIRSLARRSCFSSRIKLISRTKAINFCRSCSFDAISANCFNRSSGSNFVKFISYSGCT